MSYDLIDRFLRNNLDDVDYAEYSEALDVLCTPQRQPLTDEEIMEIWEPHYSDPWRDYQDFAEVVEELLKEKNA